MPRATVVELPAAYDPSPEHAQRHAGQQQQQRPQQQYLVVEDRAAALVHSSSAANDSGGTIEPLPVFDVATRANAQAAGPLWPAGPWEGGISPPGH